MIATFSGQRADLEFVSLYRDNIEVIQVNGVARVSDNRAHITCQKILFLANAEDERAAATSADHEVRHVRMD